MFSILKWITFTALICLICACAANTLKVNPGQFPLKLVDSRTLKEKAPVDVGIYISKISLEGSYIPKGSKVRVNFGNSLGLAFSDVGSVLFKQAQVTSEKSATPIGVALVVTPFWSVENTGVIRLKANYKLVSSDKVLLESSITHDQPHGYIFTNELYYNTAVRAAQKVLLHVRKIVEANIGDYANTFALIELSDRMLVDLKNPSAKLTGMFINKRGDIITEYDVSKSCLILEAIVGDKKIALKPLSNSQVLDLSLWSSSTETQSYIVLGDESSLKLGAPLVGVSHQFKDGEITANTMSFANISSNQGIKGSYKSILMTTAVKPTSSLVGFYNDKGMVAAFYLGNLNYEWLEESKLIQPNTYQLLTVEPVKKFLNSGQIPFHEKTKNNNVALEIANRNLIELDCYQ
jgi:hypothetical protein